MNDSTDMEGPGTGQTTQKQHEEPEVSQQEESKGPAEKKKRFQFPSTFAILFGLTILVATMLLLSLAAFGLGK